MVPLKSIFATLLIAVLAHGTLSTPAFAEATSALVDYVTKPDSSYSWTLHGRYRKSGADILELRLHSQTWKDVLWKHRVFIIKPRRIKSEQHAVLIVGGGRWRDRYDSEEYPELPDGARLFVTIANRLQSIVVVLGHVPFQPLFDLTEDRAIAYTLDRYLATGDPDWPLLLPMVKSTVRAMDATTEFAAEEWGLSLETYTVLGGSKRGWTAWLTAAVDQRVTAVVPAVIDALNFESHFPHQTSVWGAPSASIRPYTDLNLHEILGSPEGRELREIIDPFSYRSVLTQPKLLVVATNDQYFPLDSMNLYWGELLGPKLALYLPNNRHGIRDYRRLIASLRAMNDHAALGTALPSLYWESEERDGSLTLCLRSDPKPRRVRIWSATSDTSDFRNAEWSSDGLRPEGDVYVQEFPQPASGYAAHFAETVFGWGRSASYFSTNVNILSAPGARQFSIPGTSTPGICPAET